MGKRRRIDMSANYTPPAHLPAVRLRRPTVTEAQIEISEQAAPHWGKTAHDARLECPHGASIHTVFGEPEQRRRMAEDMAPAHRSRWRCRCEVAHQTPRETVVVTS